VSRKAAPAAAPSRAVAARPSRAGARSPTFADEFKARTGFPPYDRFLAAVSATRELPGLAQIAVSVAERKRAKEEANGGSIARAAALTREACTEWGDAFGVLSSITETLAGLPQVWQGPRHLVDALKGAPDRPGLADEVVPETERDAILKEGIPFGVGLGRLSRITVGGFKLRALKHWSSENLRYDWTSDTWFVRTNLGPEWVAAEDGEWILFKPYGGTYPWKRAPWLAITLAYTLARDAWFQRARYGQVIAPTRVGTVSEGSTEEQRQVFASLLANAAFDNWMVLRPNETYEVKGVSGGDRTLEVFAQADEWARRTMITTLKGETVTTDGAKGFGSDAAQERISRAKLAFYGRAWSRCESEIFSWFAYDFEGEKAHIVRTYDTSTPADAATKIKAIDDLGKALDSVEAGLKTVGLRPKQESIVALANSVGIEVEALPTSSAPATKIDFAPTDIAKMVTKDEGRASLGLPTLPDGKGEAFIADETDPSAPTPAAATPAPPEVADGLP
jgi:hypothetical protein